jgi:hypothetical protein
MCVLCVRLQLNNTICDTTLNLGSVVCVCVVCVW